MNKTGIELITEERHEQIEKHGYSIKKDMDANNHYQLSQAAGLLCYVDEEEVACEIDDDDNKDFSGCCPSDWDEARWNKMMAKPYNERLIIAGGLIAAELDRLSAIEELILNPNF